MSYMTAKPKITPKEAAISIGKPVSEWKNVAAGIKFYKEHRIWSVKDWKRVI